MEARLIARRHLLAAATALAWVQAPAAGAWAQPEPAAGGSGLPASAAADEVVITDEARAHFQRGVEQLEAPGGPRYRAAYDEFRAAYGAAPSPKILSNLGQCAMALERDGEAIESYERYLAEVNDVDPRERAKLEQDLAELRARSARLELRVSPRESTVRDERVDAGAAPVVNVYEPVEGVLQLTVRAGQHRLQVERPGFEPRQLELALAPGQAVTESVALLRPPPAATPRPPARPAPPPQPAPSPTPALTDEGSPVAVWVMLGVTGALAIGAGVVGALALDHKSAYDQYESGGDRRDAEALRSEGEALNVATDVLIGTAAAAAVVTVVLWATSGSDDATAVSQLRLAPTHDGRGAGVWLGRVF